MTNFPSSLDDDLTLPTVFDNITEIGGEAINAQKEAIIAIETTLGINVQGSCDDLAERLDYLLNADGSPKTSVLNTVGLVTLPITNSQISGSAAIAESKLALNFTTTDLNNAIEALDVDLDSLSTWISTNGTAILNHINGTAFKHNLKDIDVSDDNLEFFKNVFGTNRLSTSAFTSLNDLNSDYINHQKKDGLGSALPNITTTNSQVYPSQYAHTAGAIYVDTSKFNAFGSIPRLQDLLEFLDNSSLLTFGGRIKNFYSNGVSKLSQATRLSSFTEGEEIVPTTPAVAYLRTNGLGSMPIDSIDTGDDVISLNPTNTQRLNHTFDALFRSVKPGDIIHVTYTNIETAYSIKEIKYDSDGYKTYSIRIFGKNIEYNNNCSVRITKKLDNSEKFGVMAVTAAYTNYGLDCRGLTVINPKSAMVTGIGFDASQFDNAHYNLYLALYPNGNVTDGYQLSVIDVTGNGGTTPGAYNLETIVTTTNEAFRKIGFNLRMSAFSYKGEFGLALDPINGASFSIIGGIRSQDLTGDDVGNYEQDVSQSTYPNNVIDVFTYFDIEGKDPLGLGPAGSNHASPVYNSTYYTVESAGLPTKLFKPLRKNNYYVGGNEFDDLAKDIDQAIDSNGDGYWLAKFESVINTGGRSSVTYRVEKNLSASGLKVGKSVVIQKKTAGDNKSFGRFIISGVSYYDCSCAEGVYTDIQVVDAVHSNNGTSGSSAFLGISVNDEVLLYFSNDTVSFNNEHISDLIPSVDDFFRWFEILVDDQGRTFSNERLRLFDSTQIFEDQQWTNNLGTSTYYVINNISPKLKGFGDATKPYIRLNYTYNSLTGVVSAFISNRTQTKSGNTTIGKCNEPLKVFDVSGNNYIEFTIAKDAPTLTSGVVDIQLFPSQQGNSSFMALAGVWVPIFNISKTLKVTKDLRNFGNVGVKDLSTESLNYIAAVPAVSTTNGVINGFDINNLDSTQELIETNYFTESNYFMGAPVLSNKLLMNGGSAIINGKVVLKNYEAVYVPQITNTGDIFAILYLTLNENGDYEFFLKKDIVTDTSLEVDSILDSTTYKINNATLSELRANKSQLVLYAIKITNFVTEFYPVDIRRYVHDTDSTGFATVDGSGTGYNFKTVQSMINYALLNSGAGDQTGISTELHVRNTTEFLSCWYVDDSFATPTVIDGNNTTTFIIAGVSQEAFLPTNLILKNCKVKMFNSGSYATSFRAKGNSRYENVTFSNYSSEFGTFYANYPINSSGSVSYSECTFFINKASASIYSNPRLKEIHHIISEVDGDGTISFENCRFTAAGTISEAGFGPSLLMISDTTSGGSVIVKDCKFNGEYTHAIASDVNNSNITIDGCTLNTSHDYTVGVANYPSDITDILKAIDGEIYWYDNYGSGVNANKSSNINITNNKFITATTNQCPKILIEVFRSVDSFNSDAALVIENLNISNNKFYDVFETTNAMIAIVNKSISGETNIYFNGTAPNAFPFILNNLTIENNKAYVTGNAFADSPVNSKSIVIAGITHQKSFVFNNCEIKNNFCQRLGIFGWQKSGSSDTPGSNIVISNNNIDYIHISDTNGFDSPLESTSPSVPLWANNTIHYGLNDFIMDYSIHNNTLSWLSTAVSSNIDMKSKIENNTFEYKNSLILDKYNGNIYYYRYNTTNNYPIKITHKNSTYNPSPTPPLKFGRLFVKGNTVVGLYSGLFNIDKYVTMSNNSFENTNFTVDFGNYVYGGSVENNTIQLGSLLGTDLFTDGASTGGIVSYKNNTIHDQGSSFMIPGYFGNTPRVVAANVGQQNYAVISLRELNSTLVDDTTSNKLIRRLDVPNDRSTFTKGFVLNATATDVFSGIINLSDKLPPGVIIKNVKLGAILRTSAGAVGPTLDPVSTMSMSLYTPNHLAGNINDFTDVNARAVGGADTTLVSDNILTATMNITNLNSNRLIPTSTYMEITDGTVTRFCSNHFKSQVVYLQIKMAITRSGATNAEIIFSPIVIEYVHGAVT